MKKLLLTLILSIYTLHSYSQYTYDREYGSINNGNINRVPSTIGDIKTATNEYYYAYGREIHVANTNNNTTTLFYAFPITTPLPSPNYNSVIISDMKFDYAGNLIVYARTHNASIGLGNVYSSVPIPHYLSGYTIIAKISAEGKLIWLTYFHDLLQHRNNLTIDKNNNIYVLTLRPKTEVLSPTYFQGTANLNSLADKHEVISKLSPSGNHLWSTFYHEDESKIQSIQAADDGLYVYGDHLGANANSNYFGTANSYQEYATGYVYNQNDNTNAFLAKFNFNGTRAWSTYFGKQVAKTPITFGIYPRFLTTIGNDAYILTLHKNNNSVINIATNNTYKSQPIFNEINYSLTKFNGNGTRSWSTYLYTGNTIFKKSQLEIMVTGTINDTISNLNSLVTNNAYQSNHGGKEDVYKAIFPIDGKSLTYGSFYGFNGKDDGFIIPTNNGFYVIGSTINNPTNITNFSSFNQNFNAQNALGYYGDFYGYFISKKLDLKKSEISLNWTIYPNPTSDNLNIATQEVLSDETKLEVYDINGRKIIVTKISDPNHNTINVSSLTTGVYFLKIINETYNETIKFIKK